jgi:hypothetical protein
MEEEEDDPLREQLTMMQMVTPTNGDIVLDGRAQQGTTPTLALGALHKDHSDNKSDLNKPFVDLSS